MKKYLLILGALLAVILFGIIVLTVADGSSENKAGLMESLPGNSGVVLDDVGGGEELTYGYSPKSDSQASVVVEVTPTDLSLRSDENVFYITFETHSVELDFEFNEIIVLTDNLGNKYSALEWTGNSGWHHVKGDIIFPKLEAGVSRVTLEITGVGGVMRSYDWGII